MCLAVYSPKNNDVMSNDVIEEAWESNPHGAGVAINYGDKIKIYKGFMELEEFLIFIDIHRPTLKKFDVLIHFRWTTSGGTEKGLTHPFPLTTSNKELKATYIEVKNCFIHNGVLFQPKFTQNFSDTAIFSKWITLFNPTFEQIEKRANGDRLAFMDLKGVHLIGEWNQEEKDGNFYSNTYWKSGYNSYDYLYQYDDDLCPCCSSYDTEFIGANTSTYECLNCGVVFNASQYIEPIENDLQYIMPRKNKKSKKQSDFLEDDLDEIMALEFIDGATLKKVKP